MIQCKKTGLVSKEPGILRGLTVSDIHLGTERNPTIEKIEKLDKEIVNNPAIAKLDYIFLAGDTYDHNLNHSSEIVIQIDIWIAGLLRACVKHNIKLRVLLGTRSHEHTQPRRFTAINYIADIGADIQYIDDVRVVVEDGVSILYIPDDVDRDTDKIYHLARRKMMDLGLDSVDFAIMHGQFEYQLPPVVKAPKHDSKKYLDMVKYYIFIGHVHIFSTYDRIIAQGSFDRDKHGEEKAKGYVLFDVNYQTGEHHCKFIINKNAKIFKTLKINQKDIDASLEYIRQQVIGKIPDESFIRLIVPKEHPLHSNIGRVHRLFPMITFTIESLKQEKIETVNLIDEVPTYKTVEITPENIINLVIEKAKSITNDKVLLHTCEELLEALK